MSAEVQQILTTFLPILVIVAVFYFMLIRPQNKKEKMLRQMRENLSPGDEVVTIGGIVGTVVSIKDDSVVVESSTDRTKVQFLKTAIQTVTTVKDN